MAPAFRRDRGVAPDSPGLGSRNQRQAVRVSPTVSTSGAKPATGRPSMNCSTGNACLRAPTRVSFF
jgi:hypothetical protein